MRLSQLVRETGRTQKEISELLAKKFEVTIEGPNTKLDEVHVEAVLAKWAKKKAKEVVAEEAPAPSEKVQEVTSILDAALSDVVETETPAPVVEEKLSEPAEVNVEEPTEVSSEASAESSTPEVSTESSDDSGEDAVPATDFVEYERGSEVPKEEIEKAEHIATDRPLLEGIKVVDKIDLPEPLPDMIEVDGVMMERSEYNAKKKAERDERKARRDRKNGNDPRMSKETRSEIRETRAAEKEQKKADKKAKEHLHRIEGLKSSKKKSHYDKNVKVNKPAQSSKKKKRVKEQVVAQEKAKEAEQAPKGAWAKFMKWLNT